MLLARKYFLIPTEEQKLAINNQLELQRLLYNGALEERISYYNKFGKYISYYQQQNHLPLIRKSCPEYKKIYSQSLQDILNRLDKSYSSFFKRISQKKTAGFPKFKRFENYKSIYFPSNKGGLKILENNKLKVFGIPGEVKVHWHKQYIKTFKTSSIKREEDKYYVIFITDVPNIISNSTNKKRKIIGIDLGLTNFIMTDKGVSTKAPQNYHTSRLKLAYLQRKIQKKINEGKKNTSYCKKLKIRFRKVHRKNSNITDNFQHHLSKELIKNNDLIIIEDLNIQKMMMSGNKKLARAIAQASWNKFTHKLCYKAELYGKKVIKVDPCNTSITCSSCSTKVPKTLRDRRHICKCGLNLDRDHNAAINIKKLGMMLERPSRVSVARNGPGSRSSRYSKKDIKKVETRNLAL